MRVVYQERLVCQVQEVMRELQEVRVKKENLAQKEEEDSGVYLELSLVMARKVLLDQKVMMAQLDYQGREDCLDSKDQQVKKVQLVALVFLVPLVRKVT